jgi:UDP-N-acetylmuramyl pentapeptide phosphotransferase/UDP-N-acetylglucosamine-1-phosphate transferase
MAGRTQRRGSGVGRFAARAVLIGAGALAARAALTAARSAPGQEHLERTNFHGRTVSLTGGPALAAAATVTAAAGAGGTRAAAAALVAGAGSGAVGFYDDIVGARPDQKTAKGFRGHLSALRDGRVTSGMVKIAGVGASALVSAALIDADPAPGRRRHRGVRRLVGVALGTGVIAGTANLINLLDLRPGRALKAAGLLAAPIVASGEGRGGMLAGPLGAAAALMPDDLDEQIMLGDTGANAFGALVGLGIAARTGILGRAAVLAVLGALTVASEKVSFTSVIASTPGLRELDAWGRRTDHVPDASSPARPRFFG